jgi:DNA modification methylase
MIIRADSREIPLRAGCVQTVVTSPPYWGLRDYGVSGQIGLEPTPDEYVATMVGVFREVRRVLRDDGTVWLNLGDSYANDGKYGGETGGKQAYLDDNSRKRCGREKRITGLKAKDLIGIPWRVAFALQADGWYLRSDIVWAKPNPMPESVTDRPTRSHEYIFLLSKRERYFYDADAIREPVSGTANGRGAGVNPKAFGANSRVMQDREPSHSNARKIKQNESFSAACRGLVDERNKRSVWAVNSEPTPEAHFATFPQKLIEPCILAGARAGDLVLDPFLGSGTVGRVCERLGRRWVGLELSDAYIGIAENRTAQRGLGF